MTVPDPYDHYVALRALREIADAVSLATAARVARAALDTIGPPPEADEKTRETKGS